jgi:hypothetical protein
MPQSVFPVLQAVSRILCGSNLHQPLFSLSEISRNSRSLFVYQSQDLTQLFSTTAVQRTERSHYVKSGRSMSVPEVETDFPAIQKQVVVIGNQCVPPFPVD